MNKFKTGDRVVNIITNKKGKVCQTGDNVEDVQKEKGQFSRKYHVVYNDGTECINSIAEIEKLPDILDEKEKEYLRNVIKPFKKDIVYIKKTKTPLSDRKYLEIGLNLDDFLIFPNLKDDTMYKGMKENKKYTLKDLDLQ